MHKRLLGGILLIAMLAATGMAFADEGPATKRKRHRTWIGLPPDRHVIEVVGGGIYGLYFVVNGRKFTPLSPYCSRWLAGERVKMSYDALHGACAVTVIYNARRRQTCEVLCG